MRAARPATAKAPKPESSFLAALALTWTTPELVAVPAEATTGVVAKVVLRPETDEAADTPDGAGLAAELGTGTTGMLVTTVAGGVTTVAGGVTTETTGMLVAGTLLEGMLVAGVAGGTIIEDGGVTTETTGIVTVPGVETG
jgi:hypothetical protein